MDLTSLQSLGLARNLITALPATLFQACTSLQALFFNDNELSSLPPALFQNNSQLAGVYFGTNANVTTIPPFFFVGGRPSSATNRTDPRLYFDVSFSDAGLTEIGADSFATCVGSLTTVGNSLRISSLMLSNNRITQIKEGAFRGVVELIRLDMSSNPIYRVPVSLFYGIVMEAVDLNHCQFSAVYVSLPPVEDIDISYNRITTLYSVPLPVRATISRLRLNYNGMRQIMVHAFDGCIMLQDLELVGNALPGLPDNLFVFCTVLWQLYLDHNELTHIGASVFPGLSRLSLLSLGHNKLTALNADMLTSMESLQQLNVSWNNISTIEPGTFNRVNGTATVGMPALRQLDLTGVGIGSLSPSMFVGLTICTLILRQNGLANIEPAPPGSPSLGVALVSRGLDVSENRLTAVPPVWLGTFPPVGDPSVCLRNWNYCNVLSLRKNSISAIKAGAFANRTSLQVLDLTYNSLTRLGVSVFEDLADLVVLDLSFNLLYMLEPGLFAKQASLYSLDVAFNSLTSLPPNVWAGLATLNQLQYNNNIITMVQNSVFDDLPAVQYVMTQLTSG